MQDQTNNVDKVEETSETTAKSIGGQVELPAKENEFPPAEKKIGCSTPNTPSHQTKLRNNPIFFGTLTELYFTVQMIERGFNLWKPVLPDSKTDFIICNGKRLLKIQVKGVYGLKPPSGRYTIGLRANNKRYDSKDVDFFACYVFDTNKWYILPFAEASAYFIVSPSNQQLSHLDNWDALWRAS